MSATDCLAPGAGQDLGRTQAARGTNIELSASTTTEGEGREGELLRECPCVGVEILSGD